MRPESAVLIGGAFNVVFAAFHVSFWRLFRWRAELQKLTSLNRAIVQVLNLSLTFAFIVFAYVSLLHSEEMLAMPLGRSLLFLIAAFWYLRAAEQIVFFGLRRPLSIAFFVIFVIGGTLYAGSLWT